MELKKPNVYNHENSDEFIIRVRGENNFIPDCFSRYHSGARVIIDKIATINVDVLLEGETGTGKDTLAKLIYEKSQRKGNFVSVNCSAIPDSLIEGELFGVSVGAYTDAKHSRVGYIESSNNGVLYLDEIDSMSLFMQVKLLNFIESRTITRLGSTKSIPLDLRIIASSQTNLQNLVEAGLFRRDLYFRLNTVKIDIPPIREMTECIIPFFDYFLCESAHFNKTEIPERCIHLEEMLLLHSWPGNIRELYAAARRFSLGLDPLVNSQSSPPEKYILKERLSMIEFNLIQASMHRNKFHLDSVATELGLSRRTLYNKICKNVVAQ